MFQSSYGNVTEQTPRLYFIFAFFFFFGIIKLLNSERVLTSVEATF